MFMPKRMMDLDGIRLQTLINPFISGLLRLEGQVGREISSL